ncbi:FGGY-family carbohydrate kinase [Anaerosolibacter sp.]|uniref:FGGY-family carbohydrate kinase n=1 Tax=Anaerosolibacter sp. TaxID=1872527 RepID=UPI0039EF823B
MYVLGIDVGTQGVRGVVVDQRGKILTSSSVPFAYMNISIEEGYKEQDAETWWEATRDVVASIVRGMNHIGVSPEEIQAIAVDGTSGTIVALDSDHHALCRGIMYNDNRAVEEAEQVQSEGSVLAEKLGYKFNSSFALPKILWMKRQGRELYEKACYIIHQSDYIVGRLTGRYDVSDYSNALKSGYDLLERKWPGFIENGLGIDIQKLPHIVAPGTYIANVSETAAKNTGLSTTTAVMAGSTDGYASAIASGAILPGDFSTSIGTTLTIKGVVKEIIKDCQGRIYCHLHPDGYWMPGGASNTGGRCLNHYFPEKRFDDYNQLVEKLLPTNAIMYPLIGKGERFPFLCGDANAFILGKYSGDIELYGALIEGVAYTERLAYETLQELGCQVNDHIYVTGGAVRSKVWSQARANILNKVLRKPFTAEPAMGSAIIAASRTIFQNIGEAVSSMVMIHEEYQPQRENVKRYEERYQLYKQECKRRGYI